MKKNEVKIGQAYMANVTGNEAPVRIDAENKNGGWDAKNLVSGRKVRIKTAQRLHRPCTQADLANIERPTPKRRTKTATVATTTPTAATVAKAPAPAPQKANEPKGRDTAQTVAKTAKAKKPKKISGLTAAFMVLVDADAELGVKKIIEIAAEKGWWKSDAATPHATVYAAIIREISTKDDKARFKRGTKRGTFRAVCSPEQKLELLGKTGIGQGSLNTQHFPSPARPGFSRGNACCSYLSLVGFIKSVKPYSTLTEFDRSVEPDISLT